MNWVISYSLPILAIYFLLWPQVVVHCDTIKSSCSHTPYPELCGSLITTYNLSSSTLADSPLKFRENALIASLDQARQAHQLVKVMDLAKFGPLAKSAWHDCLGLYEDTVDQLNRSMSSKDPNDVLTWLSAAMTNHETCRNGFIDFNLKSHLESFPSLVSSSSKMLSNLLAINQAWATSTATKPTRGRRLLHHGFPGWVQPRDRKVINSAEGGVNADLVVAQDGSGNYQTISEAVEASAKRSGGNRFVIYVKAGVYKEKVSIKKSVRNLMIVGDGIGATIVTGNKNAKGGSTTYGSATFGLYEDTVDQLNRSMSSKDPNDVLTWLSAAMTNHETCRNGFIDFNLKSHLESFPSLVSSSSKMLSNLLAINQAWATSTATKPTRGRRLLHHGFPGWVQPRDRKVINSAEGGVNADLVVAQDGSGNYQTISEAVEASAKRSGGNRFVIYVKAGVYKEKVSIKKSVRNLMIVGDGIGATIVTGNKNAKGGSTTYGSATFAVSGDGFIARDITFENTAGPGGQQAVALQSSSDHSVFYRCSFKGYQDTLYATSQRQFYRNCDIYGTVDFIFGNAAAVFQNCNIYAVKSRSGQSNYITAQGRADPNQNTGFVIHSSSVGGASHTYLGRPWKEYSRTVFAKSSLDGSIEHAGWSPWIGNFALKTLYYGEYMNSGPGAGTSGRVKWPGYHVLTSVDEAGKFGVGSFLSGNSWIPSTGVPFTASI